MLDIEEDKYYVTGTGHRPHLLPGGYDNIENNMNIMRDVIGKKIDSFKDKDLVIISGMALGWDTALAQVALEKNIPLVAAIPFPKQHIKWNDRSKNIYKDIIDKAFHVEVIQNYYSHWAMQKRNEWMVDHCDSILACWNRQSKSGTANCVRYAIKKDVKVVNLFDECGF